MIDGRQVNPRAHAAFTPFVNHARLPAISIPCGHDASGLPFGIQIIARRGRDRMLLRAAMCIEAEIRTLSH
jgi:aspartyl-tRNA(Asn)/glutamyl-tRNA(Gln) amidotransferase subunit A